MAVNLTPLHDRVIVKRIEEKETVKGGIIIPDTAKEKPQEGEVIAVGAGKREKGELIPLDVKAGDRVLFGKYSGTEIKIEDQELLILREEEILAKLSGAAKAAKRKGGGGRAMDLPWMPLACIPFLKPSLEPRRCSIVHPRLWGGLMAPDPLRLQPPPRSPVGECKHRHKPHSFSSAHPPFNREYGIVPVRWRWCVRLVIHSGSTRLAARFAATIDCTSDRLC